MNQSKVAGISAMTGAILLFVGTYLHPLGADPHDLVAAFTEYALDPLWVASHLTQLFGAIFMVVALLLLAQALESAGGKGWPRIAAGGAIASLGVTAVLQAVDGVALKNMVDAWAAAPTAHKEIAFQIAYAVRQVEVGLASMLNLLFGLTVTCYGFALPGDPTYPKWIAGLAIVGGVVTTIAGGMMAYTGFSGPAMTISMPASFILVAWIVSLGVLMWRKREGHRDGCPQ